MISIIYKYVIGNALSGDRITTITVPSSASLLSVAKQNQDICAWYLVDPEETETREDCWYQIGTGHPVDTEYVNFIKTVVNEEAGLVWHMFIEA